MKLQELTGQKSGLIIFPSEGCATPPVGVYNWSRCGDEMLPLLFCGCYFGFPWKTNQRLLEQAAGNGVWVDDVRTVLPGSVWVSECDGDNIYCETDMDIVIDENSDLPLLFVGEDGNGPKNVTPCKSYTLQDGTVIIAPYGWN